MSVRMNAEISGTIKDRRLRFSLQILEAKAQLELVYLCCHAHSNPHKPHKTATPTLLKNVLIFFLFLLVYLFMFYQFLK